MSKMRKQVWITAFAVLIAVALGLCSNPPLSDPLYRGKHASLWLDDLCTAAALGTPQKASFDFDRYHEACDAFAHMGTEALPFLVAQLRSEHSDSQEKPRREPIHKRVLTQPAGPRVLPSIRREWAAMALGLMGRSAETAIPALLDAWKHGDLRMRHQAVVSLQSILHPASPSDPGYLGVLRSIYALKDEAFVIREAAARYPAEAVRLGIQPPTVTPRGQRMKGAE